MSEKWLVVVSGGPPYEHTTVCQYDAEEEAVADYRAEGGRGYRVILAKILKAKGSPAA